MSYTLNYTGSEIDDILDRAAPGGAIDQAIAAKQDALTFDAVPTEGSTNPAESGGIYDAIQAGGAAALAAFATDSVSGDVVSFPDGADSIPVKSFVGSIIPVQDLHGQSAPYPAGGGKNKFDASAVTAFSYITNTGAVASSNGWTASDYIPVVGGSTYRLSGVTNSGSLAQHAFYDSSKVFISSVVSTTMTINVPSGASFVRLSLNTTSPSAVQLEAGSTATAYAPYANTCPISGWTGANIYRTGANLFNAATATKDKFADANGVIGTSVGVWSLSDYIPVKAGETYTTIGGTTPSGPCNCFYDAEKNFLSSLPVATRTFTVPDGAYFVRLSFRLNATLATEGALCVGASASWSAYQGDTILLDFGQTVYAGTLTALGGGKWQIQPTYAIVDLGSLTWVTSGSVLFKSESLVPVIAPPATQADTIDAYCSMFKVAPYGTLAENEIGVGATGNTFIGYKQNTSVADFVAAITGQMFCYPLATLPNPIIVTAEELTTLLGANTVWTDCGSVTELTYRADTALYIQKLLNGGGTLSTLSMASPSPSLSLGRVGVLAEPEEAEPAQTDEEAEQLEQTEEPEQTEEAEEE